MALLLKELLNTVLDEASRDWRLYVLRHWKDLIGDLHTRMCLEKIQESTLVVGVYDSHWMQELYLLSPLIIRTINKSLEQPYVKRIQFKLARQRTPINKKKIVAQQLSYDKTLPPLTGAQQEALGRITDKELQQVLTSFLGRCYQERGQ